MKKITLILQKKAFNIFSVKALFLSFIFLCSFYPAFSQRPVITLETSALNYNEGQAAIQITNTLTITDDNANMVGAVVRVGGNSLSTEDRLNYTTSGGITGVWSQSTSTLTLSGNATKAAYQTALRSITYQNTNNVNPYTGTRTITFAVTDGTLYSDATVDNSGVKSRNITITPINNTPAATTDNYNVAKNSSLVQAVSGGVLSNDVDLDSYRSNNLVIAAASSAPVIDGTEEAIWTSVTSRNLNNKLYGPEPTSYLQGSGYFKTLWDANYLYVLVRVYDNVLINDSPENWQDDAVEVFIDGNNSKTAPRDANDLQYVFGYGDATPVEYHQSNRLTGVSFGRTNTADGYITEIRIPWTTIGTTPIANNAIGLEIHIADDDNGGERDLKRTWNDAYDWSYMSPQHYGTAILGPQTSSMTATVLTAPSKGTLTLNPNGSFTYTPATGNTGSDSFTYRVCDNSSPNLCVNGTANILITTPGVVAGNQSICSGDDPVAFTSTETPITNCSPFTYQWQSSTNNVTFSDISGATSATYNALAITQTTYYRRAVNDGCTTTYSNTLTVTVLTTPPGDPATFGNNIWHAYAFRANDYTSYGGYYTETALSFNSQAKWPNVSSPSHANGKVSDYQGCQIPLENHSIIYKRQGFPQGIYQIDIVDHDDFAYLKINGVQIFTHNGWGDQHLNTWTGILNASSTVEFGWQEFTGLSNAAVNFTIVVPSALNGGTIGTSQIICSGDNPIAFTSTTLASGGCYFNGYQWQSSTDNVNFTNISGATSTTYDAPAVTQTTYYRRAAMDACNNTSYSNTVNVTIGTAPGVPSDFGNNIWNAYVYNSRNFTNYAGFYTQGSGSELTFSSQTLWASGSSPSTPTGKVAGYQGCQVTTDEHSISYKRRGFPTDTYRIDVTQHDDAASLYVNGILVWSHAGCCDTHEDAWTGNLDANSTVEFRWVEDYGNSYGSLTFVPVLPSKSVLAGSISGTQSICNGGNPAAFTSSSAGSSTCYVYYQWQSSTDNSTYTDILNATTSIYDAPSGLTATTYYRRKATDACGNIAYTSPVMVTVYGTLTSGSIGTAQTICFNTAPSTLTQVTAPTGGTGSYTYQWQISTDNVTFTNISNANSSTYTPGALTASRYFRRSVTSGTCGTVNSVSVLITVRPNLTAGTIGSNQTRCYNTTAAALTNNSAATGGNGTFNYQWERSADNTNWTAINGATTSTYSPGIMTETTYFRRRVSSGTSCDAYSNTVAITVNPYVTVGVSISSSATTICSGTSVTFTASSTTGGSAPVFQWQVNGSNVATGITYSTATLSHNDVVRCILTSNYPCVNGPSTATSNSITMNVYSGVGLWIGVADTNWDNASNWCGGVPTATTDVVINSGMSFMPSINGSASCKNLTIGTGASLTINNNNSLSIFGSWLNNGTFSSSTGTVIYAGSTAQTIIPVDYYNLQSSNIGDRVLSSSGTITVGGAFIPGTNQYNTTGSTVNFNGPNGQIIPGFTFNNLSTSGAASKLLSGTVTVNGNLSSTSLDLNGETLVINGYVPQTTRLKGTSLSNLILGSTSSFENGLSFELGFDQLNDLTINTSNIDLTLATPLTVNGNLKFGTSGYINTTGVNLLTLGVNATYSGNSTLSYVNGPMAKVMESTSKFIFPIGKNNLERKAAVIPSSASNTTYTAEYFHFSPLTISGNIEKPPLDHVSSVEYWNISKTGPTSARVELFWGTESNVSMNEPDLYSLRIAHYDGIIDLWENKEVVLTAGSNNASGSLVTADFQTNFSPFTFASTNPNNPLPLNISKFNVRKNYSSALLDWEINITDDGFNYVIEKSVGDVSNFDSIGFVSAKTNNVNKLKYAFEDRKFNSISSYYRLKQVNAEGKFVYSEIKALKGGEEMQDITGIYPNPTKGELHISWGADFTDKEVSYLITNAEGKIVKEGNGLLKEELKRKFEHLLTDEAQGVYLIKLHTHTRTVVFKIIKL